jgi:site-specific DNA recombinase
MLTVSSSFAQEESKNVSDNIKWRFESSSKRELTINTNRFHDYDKYEYGDLIINQKESEIVKRIFNKHLSGKGASVKPPPPWHFNSQI